MVDSLKHNRQCKPWFCLGFTALLIILFDQFSKWVIVKNLEPNEIIKIIPGLFDLVNIRNRGAAFGILNRNDIEWQFWLFLFATLVAIWAIIMLAKQYKCKRLMLVGLGLILGGALGNLIDRLRFGAVIDFLDFYLGNWHWPAFNVADTAICLGVFLACIVSLQYKKNDSK